LQTFKQSFEEEGQTASKKERKPLRLGFGSQSGPVKYLLWPLPSKSPVSQEPVSESQISPGLERMQALNAGRSPTSLSDTAATPELTHTLWHRSGSISRRRKISVPELGASMATVQEFDIDSRK
jgi:hypothetical protein